MHECGTDCEVQTHPCVHLGAVRTCGGGRKFSTHKTSAHRAGCSRNVWQSTPVHIPKGACKLMYFARVCARACLFAWVRARVCACASRNMKTKREKAAEAKDKVCLRSCVFVCVFVYVSVPACVCVHECTQHVCVCIFDRGRKITKHGILSLAVCVPSSPLSPYLCLPL